MKKIRYRILSIVIALALMGGNYFGAQAGLVPIGTKSIPQTIVYQNPLNLTLAQIGDRFGTVIMSRGKLQDFLSGYKSVGVNNIFVYLMADYFSGANNMDLLVSQNTPCTTTQKNYVPPATDNVTMGTGDFCKIHDAIISHTCLEQYPDVCPTEEFFLHKFDGTRYMTSDYYYNPNPGDSNWQKYFAYQALRELSPIDPTHLPLTGVTGIYIDDLNASFNQLITRGGGKPPMEYANNELYDAAMVSFVHVVKQTIGAYKLIGNLNDFTTDWTPFAADMDGGLSESWSTDWNTTINSTADLALILGRAEAWIASGKTVYLVTQGDSLGTNNLFGLTMFTLVYQPGAEYRYADTASYSNYYEVPEYFYQLGQPLGTRVKLSDSPLVYQRCFQAGSVTVNLTAKTGSFGPPCISSTPVSLSPTPTSTLKPPTPTLTGIASSTPTKTATLQPKLPANATPTSTSIGNTSLDIQVTSGNDDVEEQSTGTMYTNSSDLELIYDSNTQVVGLRFKGVNIPRNATILNAYIQFKVDETTSMASTLTVQGEASPNATAFTSTARNLSTRPRTTRTVAWTPVAWSTLGARGVDQRTPNMAPVIQEIVNQSNWVSGNSLVTIITGTGSRVAESYEVDPAGAPLLHIEYKVGTTTSAPQISSLTPTKTGVANTTPTKIATLQPTQLASATPTTAFVGSTGLDIQVTSGIDDVEEQSTGSMYIDSSDLELIFDSNTQIVGLRFKGVNIPKNATILNAYIQFKVDEVTSVATTLTIQGEASPNAAAFTTTARNLSTRARTTKAVAWTPVAWSTLGARGVDQRTSNMGPIIQEIVNQSNWVSGNSLVTIITGTGSRTAESYENDPAGAPLLHIEYRVP